MSTYDANVQTIRDALEPEDGYLQLAEELAEAAAAAAKMARILRGASPTPKKMEDAFQDLQEELSDVAVCCDVLNVQAVDDIKAAKLQRWADRLEMR